GNPCRRIAPAPILRRESPLAAQLGKPCYHRSARILLRQRQPDVGGLAVVADEKQIAAERDWVPCLRVEDVEAGKFVGAFGRGPEQDEVAGRLGHLEVVLADEQSLPMSVAAAFPLHSSVAQVEACEDSIA